MIQEKIEDFAKELFQTPKTITPYRIFHDDDGVHHIISGEKGKFNIEIKIRIQDNSSFDSYEIRIIDKDRNILLPNTETPFHKQDILEEIKASIAKSILDYENEQKAGR